MAEDKDIVANDEIAIEFVEHPAEEAKPEPEITHEKPREAPPAAADENVEKIRQTEDKLLRLRADFENYKKRIDRDNSELQMRSQMELMRKILPFLDNMERAFVNIPPEFGTGYSDGLTLSLRDLKNSLRSSGLEEMETEGKQFDPSFHESLGFERDEEKENNVIMKVFEKGYLFKGKLLRPAKVFINRHGGGQERSAEEKEGKADG